ncbi:MAG: tRNA (guanosine(37)-N1)-methyltransferase TrmD [Candidatus Nealsonbacteria bacterium]|nr:tRNA (guanosine(37)-N1)-methyltransferase TrmD [Candidatus Nealsonbacteria bacterium]
MNFEVITIFPNIFTSYKEESLILRARKKKIIDINIYNLRSWSDDKHKTVDDKPFGGGLGMVMKVDPIFKAVSDIKKGKKSKVIVFSPRGEKFNQSMAHEFSKLDQLVMVCGRYEGIDERVLDNVADKVVSVGDYILMGGELPAMIVIETVSRLVPGVIGKDEFLGERLRNKGKSFIEYPHYTRPAIFEPGKALKNIGKKEIKIRGKKISSSSKLKWQASEDLLLGDHKKIDKWRKEKGVIF